jgi:ketosteroid isomerase-like protein
MCRSQMAVFSVSRSRGRTGSLNDCRWVLRITFWSPPNKCIRELENVVVVGEVAYTLSRDSLSVAPRAGREAMQLAGHRSTVYRKQPDGCWLMARDAHTLSPVAKLGS